MAVPEMAAKIVVSLDFSPADRAPEPLVVGGVDSIVMSLKIFSQSERCIAHRTHMRLFVPVN